MSLVKIRSSFVCIGLVTGISYEQEWCPILKDWLYKYYCHMKAGNRILVDYIYGGDDIDPDDVMHQISKLLEEHNIEIIY